MASNNKFISSEKLHLMLIISDLKKIIKVHKPAEKSGRGVAPEVSSIPIVDTKRRPAN